MNTIPKVFILDVDGVLTDGSFYYSEEGKVLKKFGPDDNDALKLLKKFIKIRFISGDKLGFDISRKRVEDMGFSIDLVSTTKRIDWIKEKYNPKEVIYMGDGIFDSIVMSNVGYSIATSDSDESAKKIASYTTKRIGGHRAVAEACIHIMDKFFNSNSSDKDITKNKTIEKPWGKEEILEFNKDYMLKRLTLHKDCRCSLQYHNYKKETIYVLSGELNIYTEKEKKSFICETYKQGDVITIDPLTIHRMEGKTESIYLEASNSYFDDTVRIEDDYARTE